MTTTAVASPEPDEPAKPTFKFKLEFVTPEEAEKILAKNVRNRTLSPATIATYRGDMDNGDWDDNGETVKIANGGLVLDGQHRLFGIIESGEPRWLLVVRGLDPSVQDTIDTGRPREFKDILKIRGVDRYTAVAAITRRLAFWETGVRTRKSSGGRKMSNRHLSRLLAANPDIHFSAEVAVPTARKVKLPASILGFCHLLFYRIDPDDTQFFFEKLRDGSDLADGHPIHVLRNTLLDITAETKLDEVFQMAYTIKAWNAYRAGETISRLTYRPGGSKPEPFPEPK